MQRDGEREDDGECVALHGENVIAAQRT
jgi:hypothetical protein